ncbi:hypothetical protein ACHAWF_006607 [Thalassiosira exigua]
MAGLSAPFLAVIALLVIALSGSISAYSTPKPVPTRSSRPVAVDRGAFLAGASATCLAFLSNRQPAFAKDVDPAVKGTKADPAFQACLSQCVYECTKPKGAEQKSRAECLPECKSKCATTKEQLLKGEPRKE